MQTYTVRHGDTLMQIAKEQHVEPTLLKKFNPTAARRPLLAGQTLLLPRKVRGGRVRAVCATPTSSLSLLREQTGNYVPSAVQRLHSHIAVTGGAIQNGVLPYIPRLLLDRRAPYTVPVISLSAPLPFLCPEPRTLAKIRDRGFRACILRLPSLDGIGVGILKLMREPLAALGISLLARGGMSAFLDAPDFLTKALPYLDGLYLDGGDPALFDAQLDTLTDLVAPRLRPYLFVGLPRQKEHRTLPGCGVYGPYEKDVGLICGWLSRLSYGGFGGIGVPNGKAVPEFYPLFQSSFTLQRGYETVDGHSSP